MNRRNQASVAEDSEGEKKEEEEGQSSSSDSETWVLLRRLMSKRRTWACLLVLVYALLLSSSWNLLRSILSWYNSNVSSTSSNGAGAAGWPALYASVLFGALFGLLSMVAALAVAVPATVVTWITVLVLLTFCGKPRRSLVLEGRKITADITGFAIKVVIREGNIVAAVCALLGYLVLVRRAGEDD
ncbi:PREDICTED: uncharacterized protein LOC104608222 [Nelumbo nucifera]|uniref:Uncharacterized protein LOC104608222 n=2 Tax=Nelumbo nucifera TaxID=4432 RepID=A0A1U8B071_NELNU|nr:PREDICTED: uncharacterized protein LOC104608222 [Nelumbo nucifera]DAD20953.1 TPA_asm: hypothetical protein HUJ06_022416 [Nelumbo nucifera]